MEEFVRQHPDLAVLNASSVKRMRVITTWRPQAGAQVHYFIVKLGANAGLTDNAQGRGLYLRVDMATGELADTAYDESFARRAIRPANTRRCCAHARPVAQEESVERRDRSVEGLETRGRSPLDDTNADQPPTIPGPIVLCATDKQVSAGKVSECPLRTRTTC